MAMLHLINGEKGGVGKSFVTRTIAQYHLDRGLKFTLFEADRSNQDIKKVYGSVGCRNAIFEEDEKYEDQGKPVLFSAMKNNTVVNLPSQVSIALRKWFEKNEIFEIAKEEGIEFTSWFVCNGGNESLEFFEEALDYYQDRVNHVFVKNHGLCEEWDGLNTDKNLLGKMQKYGVKVINFPKFRGNVCRNKIDKNRLTFGAAREYKDFDLVDRQRVKSFLKSAYSTFEDAGVFTIPKVEASPKTTEVQQVIDKTKKAQETQPVVVSGNGQNNTVQEVGEIGQYL